MSYDQAHSSSNKAIQHHPKEMIKMLNSRYAMYFDKRHRLVGHVFQGRCGGSALIDSLDYLLEVSRYIHLNPVEAKMAMSPKDFRWSSYTAHISESVNTLITATKILSYFPKPQKENSRKFFEGSFLLYDKIRFRSGNLSPTKLDGPPNIRNEVGKDSLFGVNSNLPFTNKTIQMS